jgi:hypothetical protein
VHNLENVATIAKSWLHLLLSIMNWKASSWIPQLQKCSYQWSPPLPPSVLALKEQRKVFFPLHGLETAASSVKAHASSKLVLKE